MSRIENVYVFVADSLRWDTLPDRIRARGVTLKTVASASYSPPSFASLATGRYPPRHGVAQWDDVIPEHVPTVFEIDGIDGGYHQRSMNPETEALYSILRETEDRSIADLSAPFVAIERDTNPHTPFDTRYDSERDYFDARGSDWPTIRSEYAEGAERSAAAFERRLQELCERDLLDSTLCIFASDHGELLGEYGEAAHSTPLTPELTVVPTVFVHPNLSASDFEIETDGVIEHVDIVETALATAGIESFETDGTDVLSRSRDREWGYSCVEIGRRDHTMYAAEGIWWADGGYVFHRNGRSLRFATMLYRSLRGPETATLGFETARLVRPYLPAVCRYGLTPCTAEEARARLRAFTDGLEAIEPERRQLDESMRGRLEDMGYLPPS